MARDRAFVAFARLHLFESVRESADRARQDEEPAAERWREAELRENHAGGAVDVHRHGSPRLRRNLRLHPASRRAETSAHPPRNTSGIDQLQQAPWPCISRTKPP